MEFKSSKGIYQQIADNICEKVISGDYEVGEKIPSVRELSAELGVNHNTIMRSYSELQRDGIIENKRGIGYYVNGEAIQKISVIRKREFFEEVLPEFIKQLNILSITKEELEPLLDQLNTKNQ